MELNEQQQWEQIKQWLKKNAIMIISVSLIGGGSFVGWNLWKTSQFNKKAENSLAFEQIKQQLKEDNLDNALTILQTLQQSDDTEYSKVASLIYAKTAYRLKKPTQAIQQLQWIIDNSNDPLDLQIAGERLTRILLDQKKPDEAISTAKKVISQVTNRSALATLNMIIGDSHLFKKQNESAIDYYQIAKRNLPEYSSLKELIDLKIKFVSSL